MTLSFTPTVDVVPSAARQFWSTAQDYEVWWEDPRDIYQVIVQFDPASAPAQPELAYWQNAWPRVRVPKGALVGAGESGWLANDDWTNGKWQAADAVAQVAGAEARAEEKRWIFTFNPVNESEFPQESDFPAEFRRTLKLRLHFSAPGVVIQHVAALTDSRWAEAELAIEWKMRPAAAGRIEMFNGQVLDVQPLNDCIETGQNGQWTVREASGATTGVIARVRYAANDDRNSFDRSILTVRTPLFGAGLPGVSVFVDEAFGDEPVYARDLGLLIRRRSLDSDLERWEAAWQQQDQATLYDQIAELPEQSWEQAWANQPRKTSRMHYTLGCEGSRQKFGLEPNGDIFMTDTYIRRVPGQDSPRLGWDGRELRLLFGFPGGEPGDRAILDGYLPVVQTAWAEGGLVWEHEAYATWLWGTRPDELGAGDDPVVLVIRARLTNRSDETQQFSLPVEAVIDRKTGDPLAAADGGWVYSKGGALRLLVQAGAGGALREQDGKAVYQAALQPGQTHELVIKIPHIDLNQPDEKERLRAIDYAAERERVVAYWRGRTDQGAQIETPNVTLNNFYRSHLMHMLVIHDREPGSDRNVARCGGFYYGSFPDEGCMAIADLDRRGYHAEAERCLDLYLDYQGTVPLPGNFQSAEGVFYGGGGYEVAGYNRNHGWVMWCLAEHYRYTRDRDWLERTAPALVKACEWIIRERQATMQAGAIQYGFLPSGSLEDVTDYWTWLATNAYAGWGFRAAAWALAEIGHPQAGLMGQEAEAFNRDLRQGFFEACARSPMVRLRDATWAPHFPARQERRGRDFGWLREVLEGPCHLIYCGQVAFDEPAASWIIKDYEDNLFLSEQYGYQAEDFERQWFDLGGFSMQSNLLLFPPIYLDRDEPRHYLRGYFNGFVSAYFPDTATMCEHALPDLAHWRGDHFKSSDEANSNGWLRSMFLAEHGPDLYVGQALPRAWFRHGQQMRIEGAATYFGEASVAFTSEAAAGLITVRLTPPTRNLPDRIYVRVRHPEATPIASVWIDGRPHPDFDPDRELISLEPPTAPVEIRVYYS